MNTQRKPRADVEVLLQLSTIGVQGLGLLCHPLYLHVIFLRHKQYLGSDTTLIRVAWETSPSFYLLVVSEGLEENIDTVMLPVVISLT